MHVATVSSSALIRYVMPAALQLKELQEEAWRLQTFGEHVYCCGAECSPALSFINVTSIS